MRGAKRVPGVALAAALLVGLASLAGYNRLTATDTISPSPVAVEARAREKHDVAVLSVDFDPPLGTTSQAGKPSTLLVVVDNRGTETETGLKVVARLTPENQTDIATRLEEPVGALAPGEVKVVRLGGMASVPAGPGYLLTVHVASAQGGDSFPGASKTVRIDGPASASPN